MTGFAERRRSWANSPQQVDPLSWFTGPQVPLTLGAASVLQAVATIVFFWDDWSSPMHQLVAVPFFAAAALITDAVTRADRAGLGVGAGVLVLIIAVAGLSVSAVGAVGGNVLVELWWAPTAVGLILGGFSPFVSARRVLAYALATGIAVALIALGVFGSDTWFVHPLGTLVIALTPIAVGAIGASVFSFTLVGRTQRLLDAASASGSPQTRPPHSDPSHSTDRRPPSATIARVSAQTVPFLRSIADAGVITEADRTLAAHLARELRAELVSTASRSWLDVLAQDTALVVSDPARLADTMNDDQRVALRGLLQDMLGNAVVDEESLLIELRAQSDGSTAVALSLEVNLPEGRRIVMLAPYYLTLKNAVENLSWTDGHSVMFRFQIR